MNTRAYLTLLRPIKTVGIAVVYGYFSWTWARYLFHLRPELSLFVAITVVAPVLLGSLLAGPVHEVMHRSFAACLPDVHRTMMRHHLAALGVAAAVLVVVSKIWVPVVPVAASAGLVVLGLSFPVLNERRLPRRGIRPWFLVLILAGCLLAAYGVEPLFGLCRSAPWLVLGVGLAGAAAMLRSGFDRSRVRERARREGLVFCFQTSLFNNGLVRAEVMAQASRRQWERRSPVCDTWTPVPADGSTASFVRLLHRIWHPTRRSMLGSTMAIGLITPIVTIGCLALVTMVISGGHWLEAARQIALVSETGTAASKGGPVFVMLAMLPAMSLVMVVAMAASRGRRRWFPISRTRMAGAMASQALLQGMVLIMVSYVGIVAGVLAVRWAAGLPFSSHAVDVPTASFLFLVPMAPLLLSVELLFSGGKGNAVVGVLILVAPMLLSAIAAAGFQVFISPAGIALSLATALACWALHRWALRRFYLTRDLDDTSVTSLGMFWGARQ